MKTIEELREARELAERAIQAPAKTVILSAAFVLDVLAELASAREELARVKVTEARADTYEGALAALLGMSCEQVRRRFHLAVLQSNVARGDSQAAADLAALSKGLSNG